MWSLDAGSNGVMEVDTTPEAGIAGLGVDFWALVLRCETRLETLRL